MTQLGYAYIILALLSVLGGSASYALAYANRGEAREGTFVAWGRHGFQFAALMTILASVYLSFFFLTGHYELDYVYHNSSSDLPTIFKFSSFWAGQEGSFLLWGLWTSILGLLLIRKAGKAETSIMPFYGLVFAFILTMVACINPFHVTAGRHGDGLGLNPLLQDYWMAIHPPTLFLGYSLMAVPFAYAMGALLRKDYKEWIRGAAPWAIMGATVLALALSMGGHWAYRTLGWGGFWGWDPVENASFVPMLVGLALVHGLFLQRGANAAAQRGNIGLAITGFVAVMYASYLTRSGVLSQFSNHSFSELPHGWFLLASLLFFIVLGYGFFLLRYRSIPSPKAYESATSREFGFYLSIVMLMIAAVLVAVGTSTPIITGWSGKPSTVQPSFYNRTMAPVGILMALMLSLYPITARNGIAGERLKRLLRVPLCLALGTGIGVAIGTWGHVRPEVFFAAVGLSFAGMLALSLNLGVVLRMARSGGITSAGGYLAHVGFGVLLLGIVCSAIYSRTQRVQVGMDDTGQAFGYHFRLVNSGEDDGRSRTTIPVLVLPSQKPAHGLWERLEVVFGKRPFTVRPSMAMDRNGNQMTSPGIYSHPLYDLYVAPVSIDPGSWESMPITLKPGTVFSFGPLKLFFAGITEFDRGTPDWRIRANLLVLRGKQHVAIGPELYLQKQQATIVDIPGGSKINVDTGTGFDGALTFDFIGPNSRKLPPSAVLDVTVKPLIWLTWMGMILTVAGGLTAVLRRTRDNRRRAAELLDEVEKPAPAREPSRPLPREKAKRMQADGEAAG